MQLYVGQIVLIVALLLGLAPARASAQAGGYTVPVTGGVQGFVGEQGIFVGTLRITEFARQGGELVAKGAIDGTISDGGRSTIGNMRREIVLPVTGITGGCGGVSLTFAAFDSGVSSYIVVLDPIALENRVTGAKGKVLEALFCAIGRQLERDARPGVLAVTLNQVLRVLS